MPIHEFLMAGPDPIVLAFDLRVCPRSADDPPRTVDPNIWAQPDDVVYERVREKIAGAMGKPVEATRNPLNNAFITCIPRAWLSGKGMVDDALKLVAFVSSSFGPSRQAYRVKLLADETFGCDVRYLELISAGWRSLGFDLADDTLSTSLPHTVGGPSALARLENGGSLNEYALFRDETSALAFAEANAGISAEHEPFSPVEVIARP